ncbi:hypothetical protein K8R20_01585 [bacterium]|nr:hypothetical protein [bacterium]
MKQNEFKPTDRKYGFPKNTPKRTRRSLEIVPGLIVWMFILAPFFFALMGWNTAFIIYVAYLVAYWTVRSVKFVYGILVGLKRMKHETAVDWMHKIKSEKQSEFEKLKFIYICPVYAESLDTLEPSFEAWVNSDVGADKIDVVIAMEEGKQDFQKKNFEYLQEKYGEFFNSMQYYVHPAGIPGEIAGVKGGNINWATRNYVKELEDRGENLEEYLLITCDSDLRPHPKYLSAVSYKYLTVEEPNMRFYTSALHTFNNNLWRVAPIIRAQSAMLTLVILHEWVIRKTRRFPGSNEEVYARDSFSSYIVNLQTLKDVQFWDPEIANDDTAFFWNAQVRTKGQFKSQEVYIPTYNDAVENKNLWESHKSYYKQQHRWGWGIINLPISAASMIADKEFPLRRKLILFHMMFENQIWYLTIIFVLTFGLKIMGWLNPAYQFSAFSYNLPKLLSYIFTFITLSNIPMVFARRKITPVPKGWKWWRHGLDFIETLLVTVNMLTFGFIPYLQAMTEMMFGKTDSNRNFYITEKVKMGK